jgi:hypothetical protein
MVHDGHSKNRIDERYDHEEEENTEANYGYFASGKNLPILLEPFP